ncbi:MAG: alanine--glyoxylate aminotransferase family protein [Pirellulales bacterium]|nr:alanine--glyoxylate aminotransferase family protein [Pirellulales bacterium]
MAKPRLMTPGPTQVSERGLLTLARQVTHHRTPEFRALLAEVLEGLKYVFATEHDVLLLTCSGTGAMEAAVVNLVARGGKAIVLESGKFSQRWRVLCEAFGIEVIRHEVPWGAPFQADDVARLLRKHPDAVAVYTTLQETSTGVGHDIEAIGRVVGPSDALLVVDGISGVGAMECRTDQWGIDVLVVGSQKALMTPPGLAFLAVSPAAWRQIEAIERPAFYFDLLAYRQALAGPDTPFTPAISLVAALAESLRAIRAEGIERVWARAKLLGRAIRAGMDALGLQLVADRPADGMTAVYVPEGLDGRAFLRRLEARFGVKLAGGQGPLAGKVFRIAQMGILDELDVLSAVAAIELALAEMGQKVNLGLGVGAASRVFAQAANGEVPNTGGK